ncbi:RNA polymerase sigma factor [[Flexibacter] sp. ATCC 35208]|uniref:RNA polymerase sigma factor n=1 Tax=[Flexibacter] sp. ATCC 35208 TaxID=1936242 RepID=UPI0009C7EC75|nr:sigma-70 family RNA polymerase sigma factor [[Flexibacter] sp. ATCC 35208]OMP74852.1 hypothetical protein BW716_33195 [[Flexibacter] sp. ATCC 35208]
MTVDNHYNGDQLIERLRDGDNDAFREIIDHYRSYLFVLAFRKLQNEDEAKDVVQEILISIWNNRGKIKINTNLQSYLSGAVHNKVSELIRQKIKRRERESFYLEHLDQTTSTLPLEGKEIYVRIYTAIHGISPATRKAFVLAYLESKSYKEIAEEMNINVQSVKNHIQRALKLLRHTLSQHVYDSKIL